MPCPERAGNQVFGLEVSQKRKQEILVGPVRFGFTAVKWQMPKRCMLKYSPNGDTNSGYASVR